jgi:hypothetical protein
MPNADAIITPVTRCHLALTQPPVLAFDGFRVTAQAEAFKLQVNVPCVFDVDYSG